MKQQRLAIIGAGSSGLITLQYALTMLPDWDVVCFEKSGDTIGCWGNPPNGFVSTSTRYTTQFACFQRYQPHVLRTETSDTAADSFPDFFRNGEYGDYLREFAATFELSPHIVLQTHVTAVARRERDWQLTIIQGEQTRTELFTAVVLCTGLADHVRPLKCDVTTLSSINAAQRIRDQRIVVIGGGESGVDMARRFARPDRNNEVYLSLRSGIRVSPRYHPIRGVPSDFLRNRLLLSFDPALRNWLGEGFVRFRIAFTELLEKLYPGSSPASRDQNATEAERRRYWDLKLTRTARDRLFNVYHNKSDDFLRDVGNGRIRIIGPNLDESFTRFHDFDRNEEMEIQPDLVVPAIGFQAGISTITGGSIALSDFYLGCRYVHDQNLYAVGFARPVIGNIPTISEMQARYVCSVISGIVSDAPRLLDNHLRDRRQLQNRFPKLDTRNVYPVEMFPYCDRIAHQLKCYPSLWRVGSLLRWIRLTLSPASTVHYHDDWLNTDAPAKEPVYLPWTLIVVLVLLKPLDWLLHGCRYFVSHWSVHQRSARREDQDAAT